MEVILTVVAVTSPVLPDTPKALTQSPTARAEAAVDWVSDNVVDVARAILSFCVFGVLTFLVLLVGREKPLSRVPDTETDAPVTAVTLPLAMARSGERSRSLCTAPSGSAGWTAAAAGKPTSSARCPAGARRSPGERPSATDPSQAGGTLAR